MFRRFALLLCALAVAQAGALEPRQPISVGTFQVLEEYPQRLIVKFDDAVLARANDAGVLASERGADLTVVNEVAQSNGLRFSPLIRLPESTLRSLEDRARARSGVAQPDLAGMMIVHLSPEGALTLPEAGALLNNLGAVEFAYLQTLQMPPPYDIPPDTPDLVALQTYRRPDPGLNFDAAWEAGARGAGVRLSDCEYGWVYDHEDLNEIDLQLEPGQTIDPDVYTYGWAEHGTAVVGETSAMVNEYGCSGLVPDAEVYTYPEWTVEEGYRRVTCITNAIANSSVGDVVLLEMQTQYYGDNYGPAELDPAVWTVVNAGTDAGVVVVGAAGNGNQNLDSGTYQEYLDRGDSGAIIVGAGSSNTSHNKLGFSTYGSRVNVQGWGENVFTLGYGWYAAYGGDPLQYYTNGFSGTSSASPFVASACVALQGLCEDLYGVRMSSVELRQLLIDTGIPQGSGGHIGPFPDMVAAIADLRPYSSVRGGDTRSIVPVRWLPNHPNPFTEATTLYYETAQAGRIGVDVFNAAGRLVRRLQEPGLRAHGLHRLRWDGRDDAGSPVPAGVYLVRAGAAEASKTRSVVVLR